MGKQATLQEMIRDVKKNGKIPKKNKSRAILTMVWDNEDLKNIEAVREITGEKTYTKMVKKSFALLPKYYNLYLNSTNKVDEFASEKREMEEALGGFVKMIDKLIPKIK